MNYFFNIFSKSQEIRGWRFKTTNQKSAQFLKNISKSAISRQLKFWKFLGSKSLQRAVPSEVTTAPPDQNEGKTLFRGFLFYRLLQNYNCILFHVQIFLIFSSYFFELQKSPSSSNCSNSRVNVCEMTNEPFLFGLSHFTLGLLFKINHQKLYSKFPL